ncbi:hypothetical protein [Bartonella koehlerae]|uniref:Uncharacterized protein n=1 Tax=Bartonella koehlerae C-29 TaxID=1134510 RepID=A0A067W5S0_9HYPH|nr:hypothetical protein [Bartonella koehlerae]KEC55295.1 hypothetical protein O9A_00575 [Bartonella koehlerae C-29]
MDKAMLEGLCNYEDNKVMAAIIFCLKNGNSQESLKQLFEFQVFLYNKIK